MPFETVAAWARRAGLSATPYAFLEALIQIQPSIPLRYVDAHTLHLGPETFMQIAGGNDQLPRRIAEGLDVRLEQPVRTIGWSGPGVTVETESETFERRPPRRRRPGAADDRARLGSAAPAREGRRARVAALRHRRRGRDPVRRDRHGPRRDQDRRLHRPAPELVPRRLGRPARAADRRRDDPERGAPAARPRRRRRSSRRPTGRWRWSRAAP